jgi:hypothetical protein
LATSKYTRQINALGLRWRRADRGPWRIDPVAAGERIVAFARPGKPPEIPVFAGNGTACGAAPRPNPLAVSTVSKAPWLKG